MGGIEQWANETLGVAGSLCKQANNKGRADRRDILGQEGR